MAEAFSISVLTLDGAALIAQATAADPIVYVAALSSATAATSATDLATRGKDWYAGKTGTIAAVSATANVARIVARWGNSGSAQTAKSLAVTARLASQTDAQAVVVTAVSDPDSTVVLPGAADTPSAVSIPFSVAINAADTVQVTPGAAASVADLERFVSMYKAGDPSAGENQTIRGHKSFTGNVTAASVTTPTLIVQAGAWLTTAAVASYIDTPAIQHSGGIDVKNSLIPASGAVLGAPGEEWANVEALQVTTPAVVTNELSAKTGSIITTNASIFPNGPGTSTTLGDYGDQFLASYITNNYCSLVSPFTDATGSVGDATHRFGDVHAVRLHGIPPCGATSGVPDVGTIFLAQVAVSSNINNFSVGDTIKVGSSTVTHISTAECNDNGQFNVAYTSGNCDACTCKALSRMSLINSSAGIMLVVRIE